MLVHWKRKLNRLLFVIKFKLNRWFFLSSYTRCKTLWVTVQHNYLSIQRGWSWTEQLVAWSLWYFRPKSVRLCNHVIQVKRKHSLTCKRYFKYHLSVLINISFIFFIPKLDVNLYLWYLLKCSTLNSISFNIILTNTAWRDHIKCINIYHSQHLMI